MNHPSAKICALYERHAHQYDADRNRNLAVEKRWLDRFISLIPSRGTVLDIGCGHGEPIAMYLMAQGFEVAGVDSSPSLIALCRQRFPTREWLTADMRSLELGQSFHGLLAWDSLFHLRHEDQRRMFPIFRMHAGPGAALMFTSGPTHGESISSYHGEPLYHASLSAEEYSLLLESNGFFVRAHLVEDAESGRHTVWLAQFSK
jgi:trans-aconitate methyltransferase